MKKILGGTLLLLTAMHTYSAEDNAEFQLSLSLDEFEYHSDDETTAWSGSLSLETGPHQFTIDSEGERSDDDIEGHELRAYYSRGISPEVTINLGWRGDLKPGPSQDWLLLGFSREIFFEIESDVSLFAAGGGDFGLRLEVEREFLIAPSLLLTPELKANFHSYDDLESGTGSGLSTFELGLRLAYEISPSFSPYLGLGWSKPYGNTVDFARPEGEHEGNVQFLAGFRFQF